MPIDSVAVVRLCGGCRAEIETLTVKKDNMRLVVAEEVGIPSTGRHSESSPVSAIPGPRNPPASPGFCCSPASAAPAGSACAATPHGWPRSDWSPAPCQPDAVPPAARPDKPDRDPCSIFRRRQAGQQSPQGSPVATAYLKQPPAPAIGFLHYCRPNPQPAPARPDPPPQIGPHLVQGNDRRRLLRLPGRQEFLGPLL